MSNVEYRMSNVEYRISNDEVHLPCDIRYLRFFCNQKNGRNLMNVMFEVIERGTTGEQKDTHN